jgi:hypothetical protein
VLLDARGLRQDASEHILDWFRRDMVTRLAMRKNTRAARDSKRRLIVL